MTIDEFNSYFARYNSKLITFISYKINYNRFSVEDIVQETWINVWKQRKKIEKLNFAFLCKIAYRRLVDMIRKDRGRHTQKLVEIPFSVCVRSLIGNGCGDNDLDKLSIHPEFCDNKTFNLDLHEEIFHAISKLSPQRQRCWLYLIKGYSYKEIAKELNITMGSVYRHIYDGRELLQKSLS